MVFLLDLIAHSAILIQPIVEFVWKYKNLEREVVMKIKGKSVRVTSKLAALAKGISSIRLVYDISSSAPDKWTNLGFDKSVQNGDYIMPECIGKATLFNANGQLRVRKDLPMISESRSYYTTWKDWHGREHSGIQTRDFDMYPREYINAPSENLFIVEISGKKYIATDVTKISPENEERNLHLMNMMLECFGEFEVVDNNSNIFVGTKLKQLQWEILPPGEYPWSRAKLLVSKITEKLSKSDKEVIEARMKAISQYNPDFLATGKGGFNGYFVYGFESRSIFILESVYLDNATYIFKKDWEGLSQLTKNEIINGKIPHQRIIHDRKWSSKLRSIMTNSGRIV